MKKTLLSVLLVSTILWAGTAYAMHISEGILPAPWAGLWYLVVIPFVAMGLRDLKTRTMANPRFKPLVGMVGAAVFIISCMPIPVPIAGTTAHPCGTGLAAILLGPWLTVLVTSVALALQALFLAHGGITTLGANTLSMGVMGGLAGYGSFMIAGKIGLSYRSGAFIGGIASDWATYAGTALIMALGLSGDNGFVSMFAAICAAFAPTQIPLGVLEGFVTAGACGFIMNRRPELFRTIFAGR